MNLLLDALRWIFDPANWVPGSQSPLPIQDRLIEHLAYTAIAIVIAALIALPLGFYIGHTGKGRQFVIAFTGSMRALPTLGLLFFLLMVFGYVVSYDRAPIVGATIAFVILAIPSMLAGAYSGLESVDRQTIDAARANGMTEWQILTQVEIPLALPLIVGGVRASVLQVIATVTIASYAGLGGLGRIITSGIGLNDYDLILGGALLVTALALAVDGLFALLQRATATKGLTDRQRHGTPQTHSIHRGRARWKTRRRRKVGAMITAPRFAKMAAATLTIGLMSVLAACGSGDPTAAPSASTSGSAGGTKVVVGSFAFPESEILGEIYAQALEAKGVDVETKFNIGPRQQTIPALRDGSINLIPEYNGNLLAYYDQEYTERTTEEVDGALADAVKADKLRVLKSAAAEDKDAYVVTREDRRRTRADDDRRPVQDRAVQARLQPAVRRAGLRHPRAQGASTAWARTPSDVTFVPIEDFGGPDTVKALVDDSVQVADIYTTSPALVAEDLVVLEDPENMISSQNIIPLVAESAYTDQLGRDAECRLRPAHHRRPDRPARPRRGRGEGFRRHRRQGVADPEGPALDTRLESPRITSAGTRFFVRKVDTRGRNGTDDFRHTPGCRAGKLFPHDFASKSTCANIGPGSGVLQQQDGDAR